MIYILLTLIFSYFLGAIPTGLWIGQYFFNTDIRQQGSGNTGSTNAFRILGKKAGSFVLTFDILKGTIPTVMAVLFLKDSIHPLFVGLFAILGHTFSLFIQFKGGKAVATTAGVLLGAYPLFMLPGIACFLIILYISRMVSLSSIVTAILLTLYSVTFNDALLITFSFVLTLFIIYRHRSNIIRIKNGTEAKVPFGLGYKK